MSTKCAVLDDEEFIHVIEKHPAIYDRSLKRGRYCSKKEQAWISVAAETQLSVDMCKAKWKNLRDQYMRMVKRHRETGEVTTGYIKKWRFDDSMKFLNRFLKERRSVRGKFCGSPASSDNTAKSEIDQEKEAVESRLEKETTPSMLNHDNDRDAADDPQDGPQPKRDRRHFPAYDDTFYGDASVEPSNNSIQAFHEHTSQMNDVDMFLLSLRPMLQRLNTRLQTRARISLLTTLAEFEELQRSEGH